MPQERRRPVPDPDPVAVRKAHLSDIDVLARLEAEAFASDKLSRRSFLRLTRSPTAAFLVACREGAPIGYALVLFRHGAASARLYSIAVAASQSGRGVGSRLLAAAEAVALRRGATRLRLEVRADNTAAIRFYEARGYRGIGRREGYYEDGMAALLLSRTLRVASLVPPRLPRAGRRLPRAA
jgi:ribosomal protein S18 acetylase RimI-like enzyme